MFENLLNRPLKLAKTHDFCKSGKPKITAVFIRGIADDSSRFKRAFEYLEGTRSLENVRFVSFDLLGSGLSSKSSKLNFDFKDQLTALENSLLDLKLDTPLVLVGHSMGCLISTRFTDAHRRMVKELILISPPVFRPEDFEKKQFTAGLDGFRKLMEIKNPIYKTDKAFDAEMKHIISNKKNQHHIIFILR